MKLKFEEKAGLHSGPSWSSEAPDTKQLILADVTTEESLQMSELLLAVEEFFAGENSGSGKQQRQKKVLFKWRFIQQ